MRWVVLSTLVLAALATPVAAQQGSPNDFTPNGPVFIGALPKATEATAGAGIATPGSKGDVSAQKGTLGNPGQRELHDMAESRRAEALRIADLVKAGRKVPDEYRDKLREAIDGDLILWREEYRVGKADFKAMKQRFLADDEAMTASDWALRRAQWFAARDEWLSARR